ncbi:MAG: transposase [Deltaproteobacteria bacterium]|nr:transposase [Deltaproteobacteria bacterium]
MKGIHLRNDVIIERYDDVALRQARSVCRAALFNRNDQDACFRGKISKETVAMLSSWQHSGFNVFLRQAQDGVCGKRISPKDDTAMDNLARYIIRASFSQERMTYLDQEGKVVYQAKDGKSCRTFPALEWLVALSSHIPNKGGQMARYYTRLRNVSFGKWQDAGDDDVIPCILEQNDIHSQRFDHEI